ncbi:AAA family ATPase [Clostridium perfringens]|uniref:AAA family ATPase n=1 Tax=Clostridium perfringens TaxID=1502 RepID=UPI0018E442DF|nr:AAA family ATPase [Clostridium perfringens]MBI6076699.1 AAA family ATPase [Clostridium perfringens]MDK0764996.1 AAA family ATPase [Clostridium perfringens]MDK0913256.1 AAA family ATPase [Clostridium perfringens]MDK0950833.1 AAA family ATPase [Clostridium perfringens]MDM0742137.1 AAA family ATPase [Clostridium perfringens]
MFNLENTILELSRFNKEEVWYIVKQEMEFWKVCYAVKILDEYQNFEEMNENLENYFKKRAKEISEQKNLDNFISTHRMLLQGYMLGLMKKINNQYKDAEITSVFRSIEKACNGQFEKVELYYDIIESQIEKVYFSSFLDEKRDSLRKRYRLFPLFLLYKVLLEIGKMTGKYRITRKEFIVFVCTTGRYEDYIKTVFNILQSRSINSLDEEITKIFNNLKGDVRYHKLLTSLKTVKINNDYLELNDNFIDSINAKVCLFEISKKKYEYYETLLCSNESVIETDNKKNLEEFKGENYMDISAIEKNPIEPCIKRNLIVYGAPGTGKSSKLENEYRKKYFNHEYLYSRVTFNPNYTYSDFIGVYKPVSVYIKNNDGNEYYSSNKVDKLEHQMMPVIDYRFVPGVFIDVLCKALNDKEHNYLLIIEEINRADVSSVFGDVFQLLDRVTNGEDEGISEYGISFSQDIMDYIASKVKVESNCFKKNSFVKIPNNMYIFATMNSADQNVNKMDTAFKRRWDFDYISLDDNKNIVDDVEIKFNFNENSIKWNVFRENLNKFLVDTLEITEDKLIGPFFINKFKVNENNIRFISQEDIKYKLLSYLKEDVLRHRVDDLFVKNYTFGELIKDYDDNKDIFVSEFSNKIRG